MEHKILAACAQNRQAWATVHPILTKDDFSPEGGVIYALLSDYYEHDKTCSFADVDILAARATREIASNKVADIVVNGLRNLRAIEVSSINVAAEVIALKSHGIGLKLASKLASGKNDPDIPRLMGEYLEISSRGTVEVNEDEELSEVKAVNLVPTSFNTSGLVHLYPKSLNDVLDGGLRGGHHVLVFAPTEMGKTLFTINACYGFLKQGLRVLYVGNEDPAPDILMRMMNRLTGMNKYEIIADPSKTDEILSKRNWNKFVFANLAPGTFQRIHRLIDKYQPSVVVLDQLRNLDVASDNRTQALEKAATEARNTAKRYDIPVISVSQAADSASGRTILTRGDVDSSNVGIPGQCDLMIGIGASEDMEAQNMRMLSFPKNKISGKHTPIPITIDPLLSKVVE